MYKVIVAFVDLQDNGHRYNAGDVFPRKGVEVPKQRIDKLSSDKNRRKMPLIEEVGEEVSEEVDAIEEVAEIVAEPEVEADETPFMNQPEETVEPEIEKVEEKVKSTRKGKQK